MDKPKHSTAERITDAKRYFQNSTSRDIHSAIAYGSLNECLVDASCSKDYVLLPPHKFKSVLVPRGVQRNSLKP